MNMLCYSMVFVKKISLWNLHHLCFSGKFTNFLRQQKQPTEVFCKKNRNFVKKRLQHRFFPVNFANICERLLLKQLAILKNTSEQLLLTLLLNSKNLLTSYEQLSYYQFNVKQIKTYELVFYKEKIDSC